MNIGMINILYNDVNWYLWALEKFDIINWEQRRKALDILRDRCGYRWNDEYDLP